MFKYLLALLTLTNSFAFSTHYPLIDKLEVTKNTITIIPGANFKERYLTDNFFIEYYDPAIDLRGYDSSILIMPFVFDVLSKIFTSGDSYHVDALDEDVYNSFNEIKNIWKELFPEVEWTGKLVPDKKIQHEFGFNPSKIMILCGGGVDSTYTSIKHLDKKQMLFVLKGHVDSKTAAQWKEVEKTLERFKNTFQSKSTIAYSQSPYIVRSGYSWRARMLGSLRMIGKALPLLVHYQIPHLLVPSTVSWDYPFQYHSPRIDKAVRFGKGITVAQDGVECSRCMKIEAIIKYFSEWPLKVCLESKSGKNCSKCGKCLMTMNNFYICGADPNKYGFNTSEEKTKELLFQRFKELNATIGSYPIEDQLNLNRYNESLKYIEKEGINNAYSEWYYENFLNQPCIEYFRSLPEQPHFKE